MKSKNGATDKPEGRLRHLKEWLALILVAVALIALALGGLALWIYCDNLWDRYLAWVTRRFGVWEPLAEPVGIVLIVLGLAVIGLPIYATQRIFGTEFDQHEADKKVDQG